MQWPFEAWGAHAVLSGHDHSYERLHAPNANGGFPFFVNGLVSCKGPGVRFTQLQHAWCSSLAVWITLT